MSGLVTRGFEAGKRFFVERYRVKDFYLGLTILAFGLTLIFWLTPNFVGNPLAQSHLKVNPGTFPDLVGYLLIFLSLLLIYQSPRTSLMVSRSQDKRFSWTILIFIGFIFVFYFISLLIGMLPASMIIIFVLMRIYGYKKMWVSIIISLLLPILLFIFFEKVAQVQVPRGIWFEDLY